MIQKLEFNHIAFLGMHNNLNIKLNMKEKNISMTYKGYDKKANKLIIKKEISKEESTQIRKLINKCKLNNWEKEYRPDGFYDGFFWKLSYVDVDNNKENKPKRKTIKGNNSYPNCFDTLIQALLIACPYVKDVLEIYL